ncbi:MAG TPA: heme-binding protein, partial [Sinorhizobium sp.]|nr:heme-binding protein [Sinorhizobium sp.]
GIRLPFVAQTARPEGTHAASAMTGDYLVGPRAGMGVPEGWLVAPADSPTLSSQEVEEIISTAVARAERTRAVIRLPLGSRARMVLAVSDLEGNIIGLFRMPDATVFSIDVAATKARTVVYFSAEGRVPDDLPGVPPGTAVTNRTIGFGAQSLFPTGIAGSEPGPFRELFLFNSENPCTQGRQAPHPNQSGVVFFPGSAPLYRNGVLVGGLGVSGDGVEQDDYVTAAGTAGLESPPEKRADRIFVNNVRLPYWRFPRNPEQ